MGEPFNDHLRYELDEISALAVKHSVPKRELEEFTTWLGKGIGLPDARKGALADDIRNGIVNSEAVRRFSKNDELLRDLILFAQGTHAHSRSSSSARLRNLLDQPMENQVRAAKAFIENVLRSL